MPSIFKNIIRSFNRSRKVGPQPAPPFNLNYFTPKEENNVMRNRLLENGKKLSHRRRQSVGGRRIRKTKNRRTHKRKM